MTTDITELAQSLKAAAEKAGIEQWVNNHGEVNTADYEVDGGMYIDHICDCEIFGTESPRAEFIAMANPANILALVEALENSESRLHEVAVACATAEQALEKAQAEREEFRRRFNLERSILEDADRDLEKLCQRITELEPFRTAYMEWSDKTDWVRTDRRFDFVKPWGKHRADVLKAYIEHLESRTFTAAAVDVLAERQRQVTAEGWAPAHDDEYEHGELADAAGCYALSSELFDCAGEPPRPWPWPDEWWKPTSRRRDLVKAGALILAEIERIDRAAGVDVKEVE